jgi:hypothetical protein
MIEAEGRSAAAPRRTKSGKSSKIQSMKARTITLTLLVVALSGVGAHAGTRTSAAYSVTAETPDAGGRRASSAAYTHDGSVGGIGGLSSVAVPAETAKHGYIGQLYDVAGLTLAANPTNVNEGATRQLAATSTLDDATVLPLSGSSVAWSVVGGPIASVNASGLTTADVVYQNTVGTVRGTYMGKSSTLGLLVLDIDPDNYGLYRGDGLPDSWQVSYFGVGNVNAFPGADPDGDGQTNGFEYVANTIPVDYESRFRLRIEAVSGQPTHKNLIFSPRYPSRTYSVYYRTNLTLGTFPALTGSSTADNLLERTVTDLNATNQTRFYKVFITLP